MWPNIYMFCDTESTPSCFENRSYYYCFQISQVTKPNYNRSDWSEGAGGEEGRGGEGKDLFSSVLDPVSSDPSSMSSVLSPAPLQLARGSCLNASGPLGPADISSGVPNMRVNIP